MSYLTLVSNASMSEYPNNTTAEFTSRLAQRMNFPGDNYEVGLAEISFHTGFTKFSHDADTCLMTVGESKLEVPAGEYHTPASYMKVIKAHNKALVEVREFGTGVYRIKFKTLSIDASDIGRSYAIFRDFDAESLSTGVLGLEPALARTLEDKYPTLTAAGKDVMELLRFFVVFGDALYADIKPRRATSSNYIDVHCDVIAGRLHGEGTQPILRRVPVRSSITDVQTETFSKIFYFPIRQSQFNTVKVSIKTTEGKNVPFIKSPLTLTLVFRKRVGAI